MKAHRFADIFPMIEGADAVALEGSMRQRGFDPRHPIMLLDGEILDGRNRYRAAKAAGVEPVFTNFEGANPLGYVVLANVLRRHLNESQRAMVGARIQSMYEADAKARQAAHGGTAPGKPKDTGGKIATSEPDAGKSREKAAAVVNSSARSVQSATAVIARGAPELIRAVDEGTIAVSAAVKLVERPKAEQSAIVARVVSGEIKASGVVTEAKRADVTHKLENVEAKEAKATAGVYDTIVIDPPWAMEKIEREERPNQVAFDYPTMSEEELRALKIPAADDAHVWVWTTHKFLPMALRLLDVWGFKYVCTFVWHKPGGPQPFGLPQYNCEFAIYARKGTPSFVDAKAFFTCFEAPRGAHSAKPEAFYDVVRRVTAGRRLDMFNRRPIDGFDTWGKEAVDGAAE